jgi:fucose 4-O-acetylase-like acetyltransferase
MVSAAATTRDPTLDNARAILITLVVIGHAIARANESGVADGLYTWIYTFHMPAFALVSGYLARKFSGSPREIQKLVAALLVPYFLFQLVHALVEWAVGGTFRLSLFQPDFAMWFLVALAGWRLLLPVMRAFRAPILIALLVSVLSPLGAGVADTLGIGRMLAFLPFFVVGATATPELYFRFMTLSGRAAVRIGAATVVLGSLVAAYLLRDVIPRAALQGDASYASMNQDPFTGMVLRIALLAAAFLLTACLLSLSPRSSNPFTWLGMATLYVYLLHGVILDPLLPYIKALDVTTPVLIGLILAAIALTLILGSRPVRSVTRWAVEPRLGWLLRQPEKTPAA